MILTWMTYAFTLVTLVATLRVVELLSYSGRYVVRCESRCLLHEHHHTWRGLVAFSLSLV